MTGTIEFLDDAMLDAVIGRSAAMPSVCLSPPSPPQRGPALLKVRRVRTDYEADFEMEDHTW